MGLDSFWTLPGSKEPLGLEFNPPISLCGGMFSGHGSGSFRGKVYEQYIKSITGVTLYQEEIPNPIIVEMAAKLEAEVPKRPCGQVDEHCEVRALARMFRAYADAGAVLKGWW